MEAQACGLPIVTTARGALPETIAPEAGTLIPDPGPEWSPEAVDAFVEAVLRYVHDDIAWLKASRAGQERAKALDWSGVAEQWLRWYEEDIARSNDDPVRLAWHFIRQSDIIAARELASRYKDEPRMKPVRDLLDSHWGFVGPGAYREQYEAIGQTHQPPPLEATESEARFRMVREILIREQPAKLLDVGCAHGAYTILLSNALPNTSIVAVDIDRNSIELARRIAAEKAARPDQIEFRVGTDTADLSDVAPFDAVFAGEVIEHVPEPWTFLERIERWVKPGGLVILTTPYGPWEYHTSGYAGRRDDNPYPYRAHIWQYDLHDLRDMLGGKPGVNIEALPSGRSPLVGDSMGIYIITYRADHKPVGQIDMERKLRHQRPRQTVSVLMLVGPGSEQTLGWCLESVKHLADEIVAGDTGCSEEARRILAEYGAKVVPAPKPTEAGFAAARNATLDACTMDWVLWIDTDERLVDAVGLHKYLRRNHLNGYALHQHHFAVDTTFKPDVPVRLFRRGTCKFYGAIHEHPETALNAGPGHVAIVSDVHIAHVGYLSESTRITRFERNWPLLHRDMQEYPDRMLQDHLVCRDYVLSVSHELRRTGQLSPEAQAKLRYVIERWRARLRGKPTYINVDTLEYYSHAVRMLGRGVNVKLTLEVGRDGAQTTKTLDAVFETMEDVEQEILWRLKEAVDPYLSRWW
jgi:2-polyprenyl-3-methyl-5-hydroxy-6-metoxy-1,4-benzoquinol methylase